MNNCCKIIHRLKQIQNQYHIALFLNRQFTIIEENNLLVSILKNDHVKCFDVLISDSFILQLIDRAFKLSRDKVTLVHYCSEYYSIKCLEYLEKKKLNINWNLQSVRGDIPIEWAFKQKNKISYQLKEQLLCILKRNGFNPNDQVQETNRYSFFTAARKDYEWVQLLIYNGADVNMYNNYGNTPLHSTITYFQKTQEIDPLEVWIHGKSREDMQKYRNKILPIIKMLLKLGADPTLKTKTNITNQKTPREIYNSPYIIELFQQYDLVCQIENLWILENSWYDNLIQWLPNELCFDIKNLIF